MAKEKTPIYTHRQLNEGADRPFQGFDVRIAITPGLDKVFEQHYRTDFFLVILVKRGYVDLSIDFKTYRLKQGTLVLLAPNSVKKIIHLQENSLFSMVSFTVDFLTKNGFSKEATELFNYFSSKYAPDQHLGPLDVRMVNSGMMQLKQRFNEVNQKFFGRELFKHTFFAFMYELAGLSKQYAVIRQQWSFSRKEALVMQFIQVVKENCKEMRKVKDYARLLHITPKYLTVTVKELTGKSAGDIIDDFVILEAKFLLSDSLLSISEVSYRLQFSDPSFFAKFFKRHTGVSPKGYRRAL